MKLNIDGCREYIAENGVKGYGELSEKLGVGKRYWNYGKKATKWDMKRYGKSIIE